MYTTVIAAFATPAPADDREQIEDAAAQLQYAYYAGDLKALRTALDVLAQAEGDVEPLRSYYLAYGEWRLAQIQGASVVKANTRSSDRSASERAASSCAGHAENVIGQAPRDAEAHALLAACEGFAPGRKAHCRDKPLRTARELAPNNPRVRLVAAICANEVQSPEAMQRVVASFENARRIAGAPDWGHAESLVMLGAAYLHSGDRLAARDALERALVIAPDYREAQDLLSSARQ